MRSLVPERTVDPAARIVSRDEAKAHLRVDGTDEDDLIDSLILAAEQHLDGYSGILGRALVTQTWAESFPWFRYRMPLRLPDVQSIASVAYYDSDGVSQTVGSGVYRLHEDAIGAYLVQQDGQSWPSTFSRDDAVTITYVCGFGNAAADVPQPIRSAALLLIAHLFENRSAVTEAAMATLPLAVHYLLEPYRRRKAVAP